jgi:hypothetical protein
MIASANNDGQVISALSLTASDGFFSTFGGFLHKQAVEIHFIGTATPVLCYMYDA